MSNLISRTPFLEETASLFTNEKITAARNKIIEWLNEATTGDTKQIVSSIVKCQELLVHSDTELLDEFLDNILTFSQNKVQEVRRAVIAFIEEVCNQDIKILPRVISILSMFVRDESPQVKKRLIQACAAIYRNTLKWISTSSEITDEMENAWGMLCTMKVQILDMIDNDNDGIRTNAIKFLEGIVVLQTYVDEDSMKRENDFSLVDIPYTLKIARRRKLEDEAINIFDLLIKFHGASHISSVNLIACMGTLCTIAKLRPTFMPTVVDAIKSLNQNLPPTLTDSQVNSVKKHMKMQLMNILRLPSAFELQSTIIPILSDLGVGQGEISRTLPRLDKQEHMRRMKRALENANAAAAAAKKARMDEEHLVTVPVVSSGGGEVSNILAMDRPMEVDVDEVAEQNIKSNKLNEAFIVENLKSTDLVVQLVMATMANLPSECPQHFLQNYQPIQKLTIPIQTKKIAEMLSAQMTEKRLGPGAAVITKDPPLRPKVSLEEENIIIFSAKKADSIVAPEPTIEPSDVITDDIEMMAVPVEDNVTAINDDEMEARKEEATKKLRETLERVKGEQMMIPKMKQRVKTLKLQEVTKPLPRHIKEQFLVDSVQRILNSERQCIVGGVSAKRRKILTVIAATFSQPVRDIILAFIAEDLKSRIDLAFSWLYEEYSLFQGFTRHSYIKSEHKPDYAYNDLLNNLIVTALDVPELNDRQKLLRKIYLEAPIISEEAINHLVGMIELVELSCCGLDLICDLTVRRPTKQPKLLSALLKYAVHEHLEVREKAIENLVALYAVHNVQLSKIEEFATLWFSYLEKPFVPSSVFGVEYGRIDPIAVWTEDLARTCMALFLAILPHRDQFVEELCRVYIMTTSEIKRTILKSIETAIRKIGPESTELLRLVENCPKGGETLITRIVYILTEKSEPTPHLVQKVRDLYQNKVPDVRLLIPVLSGLSKTEIVAALPKFLKLNPVVVKEVFNRLLNLDGGRSAAMPITPTELLVALHQLDPAKVELKFVVKATSICLAERDIYTQDVLIAVLQQLMEVTPLPTLLMRTVIQSLTLYPRLTHFVANVLQRLIIKQVWKQKVVWDGFLKCCQRLQPQSHPILLQLPQPQLQDAVNQCPDLRAPLIEHSHSINEMHPGHIGQQILDILMGKTISTPHEDPDGFDIKIKQEVEDPTDLQPPGDE